uniref:Transposase MuDR plant domain-containing protein n=1 Tax=Lactuca sativa TaxID=4236 RepID=A0A9R1XLV6_LACSA|nr:hypothetical protein LSAT_V11C400177520 [Lactuca sativa]
MVMKEITESSLRLVMEAKKKELMYNEPIIDWIEEENLGEYDSVVEDEDEVDDSTFSDMILPDHEEDGVVSIRKSLDDSFLNALCPNKKSEDGSDTDATDEEVNVKPMYPIHDPNQNWKKMVPILGMKFSETDELKSLLSNYVVRYGYSLWYEKSDKKWLLAKCTKASTHKCPFRLWATWMKDEHSFQIKSLKDNHNCSRSFKLGAIVSYRWIGKHFCRNARRFELSKIEGTLVEYYGRLWDYGEEIMRSNPGSTVRMDVDIMPNSTIYFSKYYACFKGVRDGLIEGCRKVICVYGCFLKGLCKGELHATVGRDANNNIYPIAWVVVNVENKVNWKWFLDILMDDIGRGNGSGLTIISDGHKGLLEVVKERIPEAEHRQCARDIYANFKKKFWGVYPSGYQQFEVRFGNNAFFVDLIRRVLVKSSIQYHVQKGCKSGVTARALDTRNQVVHEKEGEVQVEVEVDMYPYKNLYKNPLKNVHKNLYKNVYKNLVKLLFKLPKLQELERCMCERGKFQNV